jgi:hypothetical protein
MPPSIFSPQLPILGKYRKFLLRPGRQWARVDPADLREGMLVRVEGQEGPLEGLLLGLWINSGYWRGKIQTQEGVVRIGLGKVAPGAICQPLAQIRA